MSNPVVCLLVTILCISPVVTGKCVQENNSYNPTTTESPVTTIADAATTTTTTTTAAAATTATTTTTTTAPSTTSTTTTAPSPTSTTTTTPSTTSTPTTAAQNLCNCNFESQCCYQGVQCRISPHYGNDCGVNYCPCIGSTCVDDVCV